MFRWSSLASAIAFYTCIPVPVTWATNFQKVACFAPLIGVLIGSLLGSLDQGLDWLHVSLLTRSALLVVVWVGITGGLHLDGAMDLADGLAVVDPQRRLEVMADSRSGAFGVMAAISIVLLKTIALADLEHTRWLTLMLAAGWGRWAQQIAIARYPYLKPNGKGAFHKAAIGSLSDTFAALLLLLLLSAMPVVIWLMLQSLSMTGIGDRWGFLLIADSFSLMSAFSSFLFFSLSGIGFAFLVPAYINRKLGGQTGDTYGAVVEWTETLFLLVMTVR